MAHGFIIQFVPAAPPFDLLRTISNPKSQESIKTFFKDIIFLFAPGAMGSGGRPVQYRARKQAVDPARDRLLTRAVLYRPLGWNYFEVGEVPARSIPDPQADQPLLAVA